MTIEKNQFLLDIRVENQTPMKVPVVDTITAGLDPRNDVILYGAKIKNRHLLFLMKGENLALHYLGNTNQTFLNSIPLEEEKIYLLEPGDKIQLSGTEIIIRHELVHIEPVDTKAKKVLFNSLNDLKPESLKDSLIYADNPTGSMRNQPHVQKPFFKRTPVDKAALLSLWIIKFYSLIADAFITYLVLVSLLPLILLDTHTLKFLSYLSSIVPLPVPESFVKFFIAWYALSFVQAMIFGTTIGQFLLGLRNKNTTTYIKLILFRLKTFVFSLFLLPAQNMVSDKPFFRGFRKMGVVLFLFALFSPLLLPSPFNKAITPLNRPNKVTRELITKSIVSFSSDLKMNVRAEISPRYLLLPYLKSVAMRSFQFLDLKTGSNIVIYEKDRITYDEIQEFLEYGNPLYSFFHSESFKELPLKAKKELLEDALTITPFNLIEKVPKLGPFFGSTVLLKQKIMDDADSNDSVVKFYAPETPLIFIGSSQQDYFYLFTPDGLSRFVVDSVKRGQLETIFEEEFFTKFLADAEPPAKVNNQQVEILEAQDAFLHGKEQTLLTYYVAVANSLSNARIVHEEVDLTDNAKSAVIKNIEAVQKFMTDKNVIRSFDDIKTQLTPMENPGVK